MVRVKRAMGTLVATAMAGGALSVLAASPAQATFVDCTSYMRNVGYVVGPKVQEACSSGEAGWVGQQICFNRMLQIGVTYDDSREACWQAARS
ncbi:hypothetical protein [Streptomyces sp. NPDC059708]|uniref:hypothetical protein n=1 Tax=Streptomyces sp. NPDC059708 TaxID=3346916 RepID=UPI00369CD4C0